MRLAPLPSTVALLTALATLGLLEGSAQACSPDPCSWSDRFHAVNLASNEIGNQGVLLFTTDRGEGGQLDAAAVLAFIEVEVSGGTGPLDGSLEAIDGFAGFAWRPSTPLPSGVSLSVSVTIDNLAIEAGGGCGDDTLTASGTVAVIDEVATPTIPKEIATWTEYTERPIARLDTLVCCDGAYPVSENWCGVEDVVWVGGHCVEFAAEGVLEIFLDRGTLANPETPLPLAGDVLVRLVEDGVPRPYSRHEGTFSTRVDAPTCIALEYLDVATRASTMSDEHCFSDDAPGPLGEHPIDVDLELATCGAPAYVCTIVDDPTTGGRRWDPEDCVPWDDVGPTTGSSTSGSDSGPNGSGSATDGSSGADAGSVGDAATDPGDADTTGLTDRGSTCACTQGRPAPPSAWLLLGLLGLVRRRHRNGPDGPPASPRPTIGPARRRRPRAIGRTHRPTSPAMGTPACARPPRA